MCLFKDASGISLTQVPKNHLKVGVHAQEHEPLHFSVDHSMLIEKKAFPIMKSLHKLRHFLLSANHYRLFTDHRNLISLFDFTLKESDFKQSCVDGLQSFKDFAF
jgi:hypothetical protein